MRKNKALRQKLLRNIRNNKFQRRIAKSPMKSMMVTMLTGVGTGIAIGYLANRKY